ncbi:hypothetical protein DBR23_11195 [Acidovorax sp. HMWF018]|uniref:hypothetical protein n=1 Tax=Acidovorax sp. HMWF018 TaxID=2056855 RepID=UPI000D3C774B|nr:hypothetical protein [Acidovorax sp. HMWF018]PTT39393.1 hypothetical protein DBR23_11195 [Acidovorax sp. HMWF018]
MAYTTTQMHEHDLFVRQMDGYFPGAKVWSEVRGWEDPRPLFAIEFKNGVRFESNSKHQVIADAKVYFESVKNLTGEPP